MNVRLSDIREATYDANLDTEYREALAHSIMGLGYVSDSPLNLSLGTQEERKEIEKVENKALDSNQISEIICLKYENALKTILEARFAMLKLRKTFILCNDIFNA